MSDGSIPPGQHRARGWPVLHEGPIPPFDPDTWILRCFGDVGAETTLTWPQFNALPMIERTADFHCVTGWSKLDNVWRGVAFATVAARAQADRNATHVLVHAPYGYSANLPLDVLLEDGLFAIEHDRRPLEAKHGGPMRLVVPSRYGWKSVKWANAVEFLAQDLRGFWEERGYHNRALPWNEERYAWQET
ncbi:MAG: molybdopterin-dependent oxidoreductase [Actinomycetota bacterium]